MNIDELPGMKAVKYSAGDRLIAMSAAHNAFRRDLQRMARASTIANLRDPGRFQSIMNGWLVFKNQLHIHHNHEDRFLWPPMYARLQHSDAALSVLDEMEAEHALIDPLLAAVDAAFADPERADIGAVIDELISKLAFHLGHEERDAVPLIGESISDEEWTKVVKDIRGATKLSSAAEFMPWLSEGTGPEDSAAIASIMPPPARLILKKVWKPRYDKVSHW